MNPNIALSFQRPRFDPMEGQRNALAVQNAQMQQAANAYKIQNAMEDRALKAQTRNALAGVDISTPEGMRQAGQVYAAAGDFPQAIEINKYLDSLDDRTRARELAELDVLPKAAPLLMNPQTYAQGREIVSRFAPQFGGMLPEQFSPDIVPGIESMALGVRGVIDQRNADRSYQQDAEKFAYQKTQDANKNELAQARIDAKRGENKAATLTQIAGVRKEFTQGSKEFIEVRDAYNRVDRARETAAGDMALIYNLMKMFDPGSVVRETEFATAQNAAGVPDQVRNTYNRLLSGERLNPNQRADFKETAGDLMAGQLESHVQFRDEMARVAGESGIEPSKVIIDYTKGIKITPRETMPEGAQQAPDGNYYIPDPERPGKYLMVEQ